VVVGVVGGLVLGWIGLGTYYAARGRSLGFGDRLYADLRMLFITGGPPPPPLPWTSHARPGPPGARCSRTRWAPSAEPAPEIKVDEVSRLADVRKARATRVELKLSAEQAT